MDVTQLAASMLAVGRAEGADRLALAQVKQAHAADQALVQMLEERQPAAAAGRGQTLDIRV